jgi:hypothetical protein
VGDDKAAITTEHTLDEDSPPAGWMRLNPMGRGKKNRASKKGPTDGKHLSEVTTESSYAGSGDYSAFRETGHHDGLLASGSGPNDVSGIEADETGAPASGNGTGVVYKQYKRRWFGLVQIVLLNIIVSWDVSALFVNFPIISPLFLHGGTGSSRSGHCKQFSYGFVD